MRWASVLATSAGGDFHAFPRRGVGRDLVGSCDDVRGVVVRVVAPGEEGPGGQLPFTPRLTEVVRFAQREALSLGRNDIETEHLLLGLLRNEDGLGGQILRRFDGEADSRLRHAVIRALSGEMPAWTPAPHQRPAPFLELGVDGAGLAEAVARARSEGAAVAEDAIERTRQRKERAAEAEEFDLDTTDSDG